MIADEVNPALAVQCGFVTYVGHDGEGTAYLTMGGGCHGCSMSRLTMLDGVQTMLSEAIEGVERVKDLTDHTTGENPYYSKPISRAEDSALTKVGIRRRLRSKIPKPAGAIHRTDAMLQPHVLDTGGEPVMEAGRRPSVAAATSVSTPVSAPGASKQRGEPWSLRLAQRARTAPRPISRPGGPTNQVTVKASPSSSPTRPTSHLAVVATPGPRRAGTGTGPRTGLGGPGPGTGWSRPTQSCGITSAIATSPAHSRSPTAPVAWAIAAARRNVRAGGRRAQCGGTEHRTVRYT